MATTLHTVYVKLSVTNQCQVRVHQVNNTRHAKAHVIQGSSDVDVVRLDAVAW
jgi:hypothetical protein